MTLDEAIPLIRSDPMNAAAWVCIERELRAFSRSRKLIPEQRLADDTVDHVMDTLLAKAAAGVFPVMELPGAYLKRALKNRAIDHARRAQEIQDDGHIENTSPDLSDAVDATEQEEAREEATALFSRIIDFAADAQQNPEGLRKSIREILDIEDKRTDIRTLVNEQSGFAADSVEWKRARAALYKQHQRAWQRVLLAADRLIDSGTLSTEERRMCLALQSFERSPA